jgi:hypothetical protein
LVIKPFSKRVFEEKNPICLLPNKVYSIFVYRRVGGLERCCYLISVDYVVYRRVGGLEMLSNITVNEFWVYRRVGGCVFGVNSISVRQVVYRRVGGCVYNDSKNLLGI